MSSRSDWREKLIPVLQELGIEGQPEVYRSHTVVTE